MTSVQVLRACPLFADLNEEQLRLFSAFSRRETVGEGTAIFKEGGPARYLYIIERGRVILEMPVERPGGGLTRPAVVATLGPGEAFGWSAVVEPHLLTLSAKAVEPSDLVLLAGGTLREVLGRYQDVGYLMMTRVATLLAERLARTRETLLYERGWALMS